MTGRMNLTEDEMNLIFNKYKKNGAFNYFAFCQDVDPGVYVHVSSVRMYTCMAFLKPIIIMHVDDVLSLVQGL